MPSIFNRLFGGSDEPDEEQEPEQTLPEFVDAPSDRTLRGWALAARGAEASDLHLAAGAVPFVRVEGAVVRFDCPVLDVAAAETVARELAGLDGRDLEKDMEICVEIDGAGRLRANVHHQLHGWGVSIKLIPERILELSELGLPEDLYELVGLRQGLVLVTGPAGSGKSTTLASLVQRLNATRPLHVITIEDPIEYVFTSEQANVTQRQVGPHTRTFGGALRAALREDPDVVLVAELRDLDTIRTAIVAAETGHLVLATLHTRNAVSTVSRFLDLFPERERNQIRAMLAATLRTVVSQRLVPRKGGGRRAVAYEILKVTPAVATHIRDGRTHQLPSLLQTGRRHGMIDLDTNLGHLVDAGTIEIETARRNAKDPSRFGGGADDAE